MRLWATLGNLYRIGAVLVLLGLIPLGSLAWTRYQVYGTDDQFLTYAAAVVVTIVVAWLYWMFKPVLVSGRPMIIGPILRFLVGLGAILSVVFSLGFALIPIGIVYLLTADPDPRDYQRSSAKRSGPRFKPPSNFQPSGRVGPSGATVYSDVSRTLLVGHFESYIPIQVLDERDGYSRVVAATGESGWVDSRTVGSL
jgi:hypothetical protein